MENTTILLISLAAIFLTIISIYVIKKSQLKPPITVLTRKFYNSILCYNSLACGGRKVVNFFKQLFMKRGGLRGGILKNKCEAGGALPDTAKPVTYKYCNEEILKDTTEINGEIFFLNIPIFQNLINQISSTNDGTPFTKIIS
jgi:hypothetical protein